jgi:hypothetical protein
VTAKQRESLEAELRRLREQLENCNDSGLQKVIEGRIAELREKLKNV